MPARHSPARPRYFDDITTETQAYFLGFLAGDSSVIGDRVTVYQREEREDLVRRLHQEIGATTKIGRTRSSVRFTVRSQELAEDLARHGVLPRKDKRSQNRPWHAPESDPGHLQRHYWRGFADASGGFARGSYHFYLYGPYTVLRAFAIYIKRGHGFLPEVHEAPSLYQLHLTRLVQVKAVTGLWDGATVFDTVNMKQARDLSHTSLPEPRYHRDLPELESMHREHGTWGAVARVLGVSEQGLHNRLYRLRHHS